MKVNLLYLFGVLTLTAILSVSSHVRADDDDVSVAVGEVDVDVDVVVAGEPAKTEKRITVVAKAGGSHWIGVYAVPVEAALKSHLGIDEDRLIVQQVMDDSPAKKAGLQEHDVLLKYGDASIATVEDLIKVVGETKGKETSVALIRGGKKMSLKVTAEKRPENQQAIQITADVGDVQGLIGSWVQGHGENAIGGSPLRFRVVGPGVVDDRVDVKELHRALSGGKAKLPKNLSIQIRREGDSPAKIKVTRDGETWEVTEENLDELPDDVRSHVKGSLGGHAAAAFGFVPDGKRIQLKALQLYPGASVLKGHPVQPGKPAAVRAIQIRRNELKADVDVDQLRKDVETLKAAVKKLQGAKPKRTKRETKKETQDEN